MIKIKIDNMWLNVFQYPIPKLGVGQVAMQRYYDQYTIWFGTPNGNVQLKNATTINMDFNSNYMSVDFNNPDPDFQLDFNKIN